MKGQGATDRVRRRIGAAIAERVAGPDASRGQGPRQPAGEPWFAEGRPIRQVHSDSAIFIGAIRALLLQSLHPLAMAAVAEHSDYHGDPWGRLQRTSRFIGATTFGDAAGVQQAIARVQAIHQRVNGTAPDGRPYAASDPHLLTWVHIAEADSFLRAHSSFGARPLDPAERDGYVADMARIGVEIGVPDPPGTEAELADRIRAYRPELAATPQARAGGPVPTAAPPAAGDRPGSVRGAGRGRGLAAARLGAASAVPAEAAGNRDGTGPAGRARDGAGDPLGRNGPSSRSGGVAAPNAHVRYQISEMPGPTQERQR